jgi:hypothetical protein
MTIEREAVDILRVCPTKVTKIFFSKANIDAIQARLAKAVKAKTGYQIDRQSDTEIVGIMRGVFDMFSTNVYSEQEIQRLNEIVLEIITAQVIAGIEGYLNYLKDASTLPEPLSRGVFASTKGEKSLEYKIGF